MSVCHHRHMLNSIPTLPNDFRVLPSALHRGRFALRFRWRVSDRVASHGALATGIAFAVACATARAHTGDLPPVSYTSTISIDSARALVTAAFESAKLPVDGGATVPRAPIVSSTFTLRKGGMGEAEVRIMARIREEETGDSATKQQAVVDVDATARERNRMLTMSPEDARSPVRSRETHPINANDQEALAKVSALLRALEARGFVRR